MTTLVLLIDSDIPFMVNIKKALEDTGQFRVSLAANGPAAEDALRRVAHDVAIVDFDVPDRDIMELLRLLRNSQPGLPVIVAPHTDLQIERTQFLDIQGVIERPYTARSLIPYIREVLGRGRPQAHITPPAASLDQTDDFAEPEIPAALRDLFPQDADTGGLLGNEARRQLREQLEFLDSDESADLLEEFEAIERAQNPTPDEPPETRILRGDPAQTRFLGDEDEPHAPGNDPAQTRYLGDEDEPHAPGGDPYQTRYLEDDDQSLDTRRLDPTQNWDVPSQPDDLSSETDDSSQDSTQEPPAAPMVDHDSGEFGEVLDAVAQSEPPEFERSPDDRAFRDLVDSMREPQTPDRRPWLDDLLSSMAADAARSGTSSESEGTLDYVLDAIRRSSSPVSPGESDLDDTTIGAVIDGLFDPSFEGVLAAMSGEDISDSSYKEPTYTPPENPEPSGGDRFAQEEMADEDRPARLDDHEAGEGETPAPPSEESHAPVIEEPSVSVEDSSRYPATAALSVAESGDERSLGSLLTHIEYELPPAGEHRPRLKPLPSWGMATLGTSYMQTLFDRAEGGPPESSQPDESAPPVSDSSAPGKVESGVPAEPPPMPQDTRPSVSFHEEIESAAFQERDTQPYGPIIPEEAQAKPLEIWDDSARESGQEIPALSMEDLLAIADLPAEAGTEEIQRELERRMAAQPPAESDAEIAEAFYAGVREDRPYREGQPADEAVVPDENHLIPVPVEEAARLLEGDLGISEEAEEAAIAQAAVQLTQFSLESSAQATMLSRPGRLLAAAGDLPEGASNRLFEVVDNAWQTTTSVSDSLIRFVTLPDIGEFLLYSAQVENGLTLSMVFHADTPVRAIRRQARRLSESLALVPEVPVPPAAQTLPSRPTDLRPPAGLRESAVEQALASEAAIRATLEDEGPQTAYTCVWLPRDPGLELLGDFASGLAAWIQDVAEKNAWELEELEIFPDYVLLEVRVPQKMLADEVIARLMAETTRLGAQYFPGVTGGETLWADGYYIVSPARTLTDREVARYITYQRQSQIQ